MDRKIPISTLLLVATLWSAAALGQAVLGQGKSVEIQGTLVLPPGTKLPGAEQYNAVLTVDGREVRGAFRFGANAPGPSSPEPGKRGPENVPAAATPGGGTPPTTPDGGRQPTDVVPIADAPGGGLSALWVGLGVLLIISLLGGGAWYYYRKYLPSKALEPYWAALRSIRARNYGDALPVLTGMETKLPHDLRNDARFFIAFCHVQLENTVEAEVALAALHRERKEDENVAYLLAYIRIQRGLDTEAEPILDAMLKAGKQGFRDAKRLAGIVKFRRAMHALRSGDVEQAAALFAEVAKLGDFAKYIPGDLRNRHIKLGTQALFARDVPGAREHFESLEKAAAGMPAEQGKPLLVKARVGFVLASWIEDDLNRGMRLDKEIAETCLHLHPGGANDLPWPKPEPGSARGSADALKEALEKADKDFNLSAEEKDLRRCLRDLHFLRAMEVLRLWNRMEEKSAKSAIPQKLEDVLSRLACSRALDERFADVYLVAGLLMFYLHEPGPEKTTGIDILKDAQKLGVRDPDALQIIANRDRLERANADAVDRYQQLLDRYLRDETVRHEVRRALLERLSTHRSLMNRYKPPDLSRARTVPPTVSEMFARSSMLHERISALRFSKTNKELTERGKQLKAQGEALTHQAAALENLESELLVMTGDELFTDG